MFCSEVIFADGTERRTTADRRNEETFHVFSSSNNAKYLKFYDRKVESTRNSNFGDYPGDIRL